MEIECYLTSLAWPSIANGLAVNTTAATGSALLPVISSSFLASSLSTHVVTSATLLIDIITFWIVQIWGTVTLPKRSNASRVWQKLKYVGFYIHGN